MLHADGIHDDTMEIQQMLDKRGIVMLPGPGTYLISRTLKIHSGTRIILSPGVRMMAAPYSCCALIENAHFAGEERDSGIVIEGGVWDGQCDRMGLDPWQSFLDRLSQPYSPELFRGKLIRFAHVDNLTLSGMTVKDPVSYGIQIADAIGFTVRDICFDYNCHFATTDGVHINGPARCGLIENLWGVTNDDMVSLTPDDECHAEITRGEIAQVEIRNIRAESGYSGVRLLSCGHALRDIYIGGVYGEYCHNAVLFSHHSLHPGDSVWLDGIVVERVHACKPEKLLGADCLRQGQQKAVKEEGLVWFAKGVRMGSVVLRDIRRTEVVHTEAALIQLDEDVEIERLTIENASQVLPEGCSAPILKNGARVRYMSLKLD